MARQAALRSSAALRALYEEVAGYPLPGGDGRNRPAPHDVPAGQEGAGAGATPFALPLRIEVEGRPLSFISTATTFNTPMDVTVSELAVETFLPADAETVTALRELRASR
jgi:hypothetical protein